MSVTKTTPLAAATICSAMTVSGAATNAGEIAGISMLKVIRVETGELKLNGVGIGTKLFLQVYVAGLYLERKTSDAQTAISSNEAKRMVLTMLRDVSRRPGGR